MTKEHFKDCLTIEDTNNAVKNYLISCKYPESVIKNLMVFCKNKEDYKPYKPKQ